MQNYIGKSSHIDIDGTMYKLSRFERRILRSWMDWATRKLPNPLTLLRPELLQSLPVPVQEALVKKAYDDARSVKDITSPEMQEIFASMEGQWKIASLLLQDNHPELNEDQAHDLIARAFELYGEEYIVELISAAEGERPISEGEAEDAMYRAKGWIPPLDQKKSSPTENTLTG